MALSKNAQIIKFFIERAGRAGAGRTRLVKLLYMADLEARRLMGRPISGLDYYFHNHGPFDSSFFSAAEELVRAGLADPEALNHGSGYIEKLLVDRGHRVESQFSPAERHILAYVAGRYLSMDLQGLLRVVYATEPMKAVKDHRGKTLPMAMVDRADAERIPFDFESIAEAEWATLNGDYVRADDFFESLRTEAVG